MPDRKVDRKLEDPESNDKIKKKGEDLIKTILMKKPFMLIRGPGIQKVIEPKAMDINFLDKSKKEDEVAPELGVLSMYDLKPWDARQDQQNQIKLGKDYKSNINYREAMEILDNSLTSNQGLLRKTFQDRKGFSLPELGKHYLSILPRIFRYSRHLTDIGETKQKYYRTGEGKLNDGIENKPNVMNKDIRASIDNTNYDDEHEDKLLNVDDENLKDFNLDVVDIVDEAEYQDIESNKDRKHVKENAPNVKHLSWKDFETQIINLARDAFPIMKKPAYNQI